MRAIHCICIDIGDCIEISSHPMSDAPFFIHLHQHVSQCHFGESHDYRYSLRKRPCCIPIRNQCFLFSRGDQTFAAEGSQVVRRVKFIYGQAEKLGGYIGVSSEILFAFSHCLFIFVQTVPETCFHACLR